ncbi:MAG: hypothetical protein PUP93_23435 [Rhizonema sp. NSF051]|nr:hypothetical protein [Rhizonema sp. NSF051]
MMKLNAPSYNNAKSAGRNLPSGEFCDPGSVALLMIATAGLMIVDIVYVHHLLIPSLIFATAIILAIPKQTNKLLTNFERLQRRMGINLYAILFSLVAVVFVLDFATAPVSAQFLNNAETWMKSAFSGISADTIALIFNVLRGLFLLYLGISLVRIVNSARNDEDWQTLARTPLIIAVTVVLGDILSGLVTGNGTGTGTAGK